VSRVHCCRARQVIRQSPQCQRPHCGIGSRFQQGALCCITGELLQGEDRRDARFDAELAAKHECTYRLRDTRLRSTPKNFALGQ
jgi:hypothetical protein